MYNRAGQPARHRKEIDMYYWKFTPDSADIAACKAYLPLLGNDAEYKTKSQAIWHGKRWMKESGRTGTIEAVRACRRNPTSYILDI